VLEYLKVFGHAGFFVLPPLFSPMGEKVMGTLEWIILILVLLIVFGGGGGYYWTRRGR